MSNIRKSGKTKLQKLVSYLEKSAIAGRPVTRSTIEKRFSGDASIVVYFNGLRRNGAVFKSSNKVNVNRMSIAITAFRKENRQRQLEHYENKKGTNSATG